MFHSICDVFVYLLNRHFTLECNQRHSRRIKCIRRCSLCVQSRSPTPTPRTNAASVVPVLWKCDQRRPRCSGRQLAKSPLLLALVAFECERLLSPHLMRSDSHLWTSLLCFTTAAKSVLKRGRHRSLGKGNQSPSLVWLVCDELLLSMTVDKSRQKIAAFPNEMF